MEYKDKKYTYLGGLVHGISTLATGMKTSIKVYFRKKVTEQYPENRKELKMFDRFRGTLNMPHNENNEHRRVKSVFNAVRAFLTTSILYQNLFKITRYKAVFSVFTEIFFLFFTTGSSLSKTLLPESVYYKKRTAAAVLFYRV